MKLVLNNLMKCPFNIFYKGELIPSFTPFKYDLKDEEMLLSECRGIIVQKEQVEEKTVESKILNTPCIISEENSQKKKMKNDERKSK